MLAQMKRLQKYSKLLSEDLTTRWDVIKLRELFEACFETEDTGT